MPKRNNQNDNPPPKVDFLGIQKGASHSCQSYLKSGKQACRAPLINKERLETAVLDRVQEHILSEENVRKYIELVIEQAQNPNQEAGPEENAVDLEMGVIEAKLRRWEEALERGLLSLEECAQRIRELRLRREGLLKRKKELRKLRSKGNILPIPTPLMGVYVKEMQTSLREKQIGYRKEFLREILKEVRIRGSEAVLTYKLPLRRRSFQDSGQGGFFTALKMVVAPGLEPGTSCM